MSHYDWLEKNLSKFFERIGMAGKDVGLISAHGDKCRQYSDEWERRGIPFEHGAAIYLLSYCHPFSKTVRETKDGWVTPKDWVMRLYPNYCELLKEIEKE